MLWKLIRTLAFIWTALAVAGGVLLWHGLAPQPGPTTGMLTMVGLLVAWAVPSLALALLKPLAEE